MEAYLRSVSFIGTTPARRKFREMSATDRETHGYRTPSGEMVWPGSAVMLQAAFFALSMQQKIPGLTVEHLVNYSAMLKSLMAFQAKIRYRTRTTTRDVDVITSSDAAFNVSKNASYGQTGFETVNFFNDDAKPMYFIFWAGFEKHEVRYSSYGTEILACTDADDRGYYIKMAMWSMMAIKPKHILVVDSTRLLDTRQT